MKKVLSLFLTIATVFSLAACGTTGNRGESSSEPSSEFSAESSGSSAYASGGATSDGESSGVNNSESPQSTSDGESSGAEASNPQQGTPETSGTSGTAESSGNVASGGKILVAYFSWADNAILADDVDAVASPSVIPPGNVQQLAGWVQEKTGGDLFSIQVTEPYSSDWDECLTRANRERGANARPKLKENVANLDRYDTVFLGYPNWWYGVPMALLTFLEQNDLSGKRVYLFCSHGTGGLARSVVQITEAAPDALISDNIFDCYEEEAPSSKADIQSWVSGLGY